MRGGLGTTMIEPDMHGRRALQEYLGQAGCDVGPTRCQVSCAAP